MKLGLTERQYKLVISEVVKSQEIEEQGEPVNPEPEAGTSAQQSGGKGYPAVGKWESGVTRGPANQVGITKWSDVVGASLKRGKANQLKEQGSLDINFNRRYGTAAAAEKSNKENRELVQGVVDFYKKYNHEVNTVLAIGAIFIPFVGPVLSSGIGLMDAAQYYNEGDTKMAGMVGMFALLPGVGSIASKIPGVKTLGAKGMSELAKKLTLGTKITNPTEIEVVSKMAKYKDLIKAEMEKIGKDATIAAARKGVQKNIVRKNVVNKALGTGAGIVGYGGLGVAYSMGYDKLTGKPKQDINTFKQSKPEVFNSKEMVLVNGEWEFKD
jgi:hypothetical protein